MVRFQLNLADAKQSYKKEIDDDAMTRQLIGKKLGDELDGNFIIYSVNFFDNLGGSAEGDFWSSISIPQGISEETLKEINACTETPGFMLISIITALFLVVIGKRYYKKR